MIEETGGVVMKKQNLFTKFRKWLRHIRTETNYFTYGTSLLLFVGISFFLWDLKASLLQFYHHYDVAVLRQ